LTAWLEVPLPEVWAWLCCTRRPSPVRALLPWGFLSLQSARGGKASALLVRRSLYGLAALAAAWEVFAFPLIPANQLCGSPSHEIRPPSEFCRTALPPLLMELLPLLGFPSPVAPSAWEVYLTRSFACSTMFRLQVFATSWRLAPPNALWLCFVPLAPVGFSLQSFPPCKEPYRLSAAVALLSFPAGPSIPKKRDYRPEPPSGPCSPWKSAARRLLVRPAVARCSRGIAPL